MRLKPETEAVWAWRGGGDGGREGASPRGAAPGERRRVRADHRPDVHAHRLPGAGFSDISPLIPGPWGVTSGGAPHPRVLADPLRQRS